MNNILKVIGFAFIFFSQCELCLQADSVINNNAENIKNLQIVAFVNYKCGTYSRYVFNPTVYPQKCINITTEDLKIISNIKIESTCGEIFITMGSLQTKNDKYLYDNKSYDVVLSNKTGIYQMDVNVTSMGIPPIPILIPPTPPPPTTPTPKIPLPGSTSPTQQVSRLGNSLNLSIIPSIACPGAWSTCPGSGTDGS